MPRPTKNRMVQNPPMFNAFKPMGVPGRNMEEITLTLDEYEALRLADYLQLSHEESAIEMEISRSTFSRLIEKSRKKVAQMMVNGKMLVIDGGDIHFKSNLIKCQNCGQIFKTHMGVVMSKCPECNSINLLNLAGGFGHGKCCKPNDDGKSKEKSNQYFF